MESKNGQQMKQNWWKAVSNGGTKPKRLLTDTLTAKGCLAKLIMHKNGSSLICSGVGMRRVASRDHSKPCSHFTEMLLQSLFSRFTMFLFVPLNAKLWLE